MAEEKLFMLLLGCRPKGRNTEQHDVYFGIGSTLKDLLPGIKASWPGAGEIHIDAWRMVTAADGYSINIQKRSAAGNSTPHPAPAPQLFFINLGGYRQNEFDEFHYKILVVADTLEEAKAQAKRTAFFKHNGLPNSATARNAVAHIDDKFGVDVDDLFAVKDILPAALKEQYRIELLPSAATKEDEIHLGYLRLVNL
ncbi:MAG TPA: DUF1543 domain-containing protein [Chitinophagaceae bacterium]|nr:DUF1543 domain-containing protein [Chitinophagaceae bacterium]